MRVRAISEMDVLLLLCLGLACYVSADTMQKKSHQIASLHRYQPLHVSHLAHRLLHGHAEDLGHSREIKLNLFERDMHVHLVVHRSLFHPKFVAHEVDQHNRKHPRAVNKAAFYHGVVRGEDGSSVVAHVDDKNVVSASIHTVHGVYSIEPSHRHIKVPHDFHMIAYRDTDIKSRPGAKACGVTPDDEADSFGEDTFTYAHDIFGSFSSWAAIGKMESNSSHAPQVLPASHRRLKRQAATSGRVCPVTLVADYLYSSGIGGGDFQTVASSMIQQLNFADTQVFSRTSFTARNGDALPSQYGMQLRNVIVHSAANTSIPYNTGNTMAVRDLLRAMTFGDWNTTAQNDMPGTCLAHLFTHQGFSGNVLGLAYVASPDRNSVGGMCNVVFQRNRWLNVGLTTTQNCPSGDGNNCQILIQREVNLVTAHELGHNWGANHDSTTECVSDSEGRFLMNRYALPGTENNNNVFSTCSRTSIGAVILGKGSDCLVDRLGEFCGNGLREGMEQCDAGFNNNADTCCDTSCRYRSSAFVCSDVNDPCCVNCMYASSDRICRTESSDTAFSCLANSTCTGVDTRCEIRYKPAGSRCGDFGSCQDSGSTRCLGYCESTLNQISCVCPALQDQCTICCKTAAGEPCRSVNNTLRVQNGAFCDIGFCFDGVCEQADLDTTEKLFGLFTDFSADTIARWFRNNIVAAVLISTFIVWLIAGLIIHYMDRKKMKKFNDDFKAYQEQLKEYLGKQKVSPLYSFNNSRRKSRIDRRTRTAGPQGRQDDSRPLMSGSEMVQH